MSDAVSLVALNLGLAALGAFVVVLGGIPRARPFVPTVVGLSLAVGLATGALAATVGAMVGIDVGLVSATAIAGVAVLGLAVAVRRRPLRPPPGPVATGRVGRGLEALALVLLGVLSLSLVRLAAATPLDQWDGWALWGAKAHALYAGGDVWSPVFTEPEYVMQHQEYPVLLPALEALSAEALGRFDPKLIDVQAAVVVVAFGLAAWGLLRLVVHPALAAGAALALTGSAPLAANAGANYADTVVASFTALGVLVLFLWLVRGAPAFLILAGLFLSAAALTKSEGLLFALAGVATALVLARSFGRSVRTAGMFAAAVLALPAVWAIVDRLNGPGADNVDAGALVDPDAFSRIPTAADALLGELVSGWTLAAVAVGVALAAACLARSWPAAAFVGLWVGLSFGALVLVYFVSTNPIDWHLGTSADRVVFSIALGAATLAPVLAALAWRVTDEAGA